jgi:rhodanese-related sulfurtransferase
MCTLSTGRLKELSTLCFVETVSKDIDPFRMNLVKSAQAMYLLAGDLGLRLKDGTKQVLKGGSEAAKHPIFPTRLALQDAIALTEIQIVRIDLDLLDIMMTWDQLAGMDHSVGQHQATTAGADKKRDAAAWMGDTSAFSVGKLQSGVFSRLPSANVEEMFRRMTNVSVKAGQVVIRQGAEGDYYYLIESGTAQVSRAASPGDSPEVLAELNAGDAFGEEALVSDNKRNATVTMKTDGSLLRLNKTDFVELLKAPLINHVSMADAKSKVEAGALWLDVRLPSEYKFDHLPTAINLPLNQIRNLVDELDKTKQYIAYCQTGRRSSAAAFVLVQHGFNVWVLNGGTRGVKA